MPRAPQKLDRTKDGSNLQEAIVDPGPLDVQLALPLKALSIGTLAELHKTIGSADGIAGPRVCMLAGQLAPLDAGCGLFVWDPTSVLADNAATAASAFTVANPGRATTATGRWRRMTTLNGFTIPAGQVLFSDATTHHEAGNANFVYNSSTNVLTLTQPTAFTDGPLKLIGGTFSKTIELATNGDDIIQKTGTGAGNLTIKSLTGGNFSYVNSSATVFNIPTTGEIQIINRAAPASPPVGDVSLYSDSTSKNMAFKNDAGVVNHGVQTKAAVASNWIRSIADDGSSLQSQPAFTDITGTTTTAQLGTNTVTNAVLAQMPTLTIKGNNTGGTANALDLTVSQVQTMVPGHLKSFQILISGTTYTRPAGVSQILVELWGGGGGGGGSAIGTAANAGCGGGGGSGGYARRFYNPAPASGTFAIGAGGAAGANTGAAAGNGGSTTFTDGTTLVTALGGTGAPAQFAVGATAAIGLGGAGAAASTNSNLSGGSGQAGGCAIRISGTAGVQGGGGGSTSLGGGGQERVTQGTGNAAIANSGSGGGGAVAIGAVAAVVGSTGAAGVIFVWEFS